MLRGHRESACLLSLPLIMAFGAHSLSSRASSAGAFTGHVALLRTTPGTVPMSAGELGTLGARTEHTATLLGDGRVLVAGGVSPARGDFHASVEIFDPVTRAWLQAAGMNAPRAYHSAALLGDGRVLAVGGQGIRGGATPSQEWLTTAEVFDPTSGVWTQTADLVAAHAQRNPKAAPALVALPDRSALVAGGSDESAAVVERFGPAAGAWRLLDRSPLVYRSNVTFPAGIPRGNGSFTTMDTPGTLADGIRWLGLEANGTVLALALVDRSTRSSTPRQSASTACWPDAATFSRNPGRHLRHTGSQLRTLPGLCCPAARSSPRVEPITATTSLAG